MTISLTAFQQTANIKPQGELQLNTSGQQVENRGTVGNNLTRFFQSIGAFFGLCQKPPAEQERQATALTAFREALTTRFGEDVTQQVAQGLSGPLTGSKVSETITQARRLLQESRFANEKTVAKMMPGEYIETPVMKDVSLRSMNHAETRMGKGGLYDKVQTQEKALENFTQLCTDAGVKDVEKFTTLFNPYNNYEPTNAHTLYREMLMGATYSDSRGNVQTVSENSVKLSANDQLKTMRKLTTGEEVAQAHQNFTQYADAIKTMLSDIANHRDTNLQQLAQRVDLASEGTKDAFKLEGGMTSDDGMPIAFAAFGKALSELPQTERTALFERLANKDNPLSAFSGTNRTFATMDGMLGTFRPN